jgi:hypothetical protein
MYIILLRNVIEIYGRRECDRKQRRMIGDVTEF